MSEGAMRAILLASGAIFIGLGAWEVIDPGSFYDALANWPPENHHLLRDDSRLNLGLGIMLVLAAGRPSWRAPILVFATLQFVIHGINHIADVNEAEKDSSGVFAVVSLLASAFLFAGLARISMRRERE